MITYSELTDAQRAQAAYLFADSYFGTDAHAYRYTLDRSGTIIRRTRINADATPKRKRAHRSTPVQVIVLQEVNLTDDLLNQTRHNLNAFAALIAKQIQISQLEEVTA